MTEFKIGQYASYQRHKAEGRFVVIRLVPQPQGLQARSRSLAASNRRSLGTGRTQGNCDAA
jgi:hypothetical protein